MSDELRCEGCGAPAVVIFEPDPNCVWGVCLDCAATSHVGHGATMHRLAQGLCGAALREGMLREELAELREELAEAGARRRMMFPWSV